MPIVLVVEHEEVVRATVATILTRSGFEVLKAASLAEADRLCRERPEPIDLVIVNDAVVDASGPEVVKHVMRCHPEAKEMRFSGWPREYLLDQGTLAPQEPFVMKPFRTGEFLEQVRRVLGWLPNEQRARAGAAGAGRRTFTTGTSTSGHEGTAQGRRREVGPLVKAVQGELKRR